MPPQTAKTGKARGAFRLSEDILAVTRPKQTHHNSQNGSTKPQCPRVSKLCPYVRLVRLCLAPPGPVNSMFSPQLKVDLTFRRPVHVPVRWLVTWAPGASDAVFGGAICRLKCAPLDAPQGRSRRWSRWKQSKQPDVAQVSKKLTNPSERIHRLGKARRVVGAGARLARSAVSWG